MYWELSTQGFLTVGYQKKTDSFLMEHQKKLHACALNLVNASLLPWLTCHSISAGMKASRRFPGCHGTAIPQQGHCLHGNNSKVPQAVHPESARQKLITYPSTTLDPAVDSFSIHTTMGTTYDMMTFIYEHVQEIILELRAQLPRPSQETDKASPLQSRRPPLVFGSERTEGNSRAARVGGPRPPRNSPAHLPLSKKQASPGQR